MATPIAIKKLIALCTPVDLGGGNIAYLQPVTGDWLLQKLGRLPAAFAATVEASMSQVAAKEAEAFSREHPTFAIDLAHALITGGVKLWEAHDPETGERAIDPVTLVTKTQHECLAGEMSLDLIPDETQAKIINAALELNGFTTEAAEKKRLYFRGETVAFLARYLSEAVRETSDGDRPPIQ